AGSWPVELSAADSASEAVGATLAEAGRALKRERGADVIVLGCAGMARHRGPVAAACDRPVVEPSQQAVAAALGAVLLGGAA
ncbi:MAG: Asp/Glu racemase, partial [Methylobacterium sp.]